MRNYSPLCQGVRENLPRQDNFANLRLTRSWCVPLPIRRHCEASASGYSLKRLFKVESVARRLTKRTENSYRYLRLPRIMIDLHRVSGTERREDYYLRLVRKRKKSLEGSLNFRKLLYSTFSRCLLFYYFTKRKISKIQMYECDVIQWTEFPNHRYIKTVPIAEIRKLTCREESSCSFWLLRSTNTSYEFCLDYHSEYVRTENRTLFIWTLYELVGQQFIY